MKWNFSKALFRLSSRFLNTTNSSQSEQRLVGRVEAVRLAMLDLLGEDGMRRFPQVARRIHHTNDAQDLWYARSDLMAALAEIYGEKQAQERVLSLSNLFNGLLPKSLTASK